MFTRKRVNPLSYSIDIDGLTINSSSSHKFLGVTLDYRLFGKEHTSYLVSKCSKLSNVLRALKGIPARSGILKNETADLLAKKRRLTQQNDIETTSFL
ncbi:type-1 retrotransposable element r1dm [Lasius niger]|uniref:Type-1 retrotransposable element r1dm n=1 Tax=Lasius niger TaxID=67767 RepID=A0A0J7K924_LASNI|nr:type-1 retrotransposable element r1dm [Lasius niger]